MNDEIWLFDSNILVYAFDKKDSRQEKAADLVKQGTQGDLKVAVSLQNLTELFDAITRKVPQKISFVDAEKVVNAFLEHNNWIKLIPKEKTLTKAMNLTSKYKIQFWDAMIAAVMLENGIHKIITEDKGFQQIPGIIVKNPFEKQK